MAFTDVQWQFDSMEWQLGSLFSMIFHLYTFTFQDREPEIKPLPYEGERETKFVYNECEVCDKVFVLEHIWKGELTCIKSLA